MPNQIANKQQNLVRRNLERCGHNVRDCRFERAAKRSGGSGEKFVRDRYSAEVKEHRRRAGKGSALLVVMVDADMGTTQHRASQLSDALRDVGMKDRAADELIVVLIPKRHAETWIRALLGGAVNEEQSYKNPKPTPNEIHEAAETVHRWTRPNANPNDTYLGLHPTISARCVTSITQHDLKQPMLCIQSLPRFFASLRMTFSPSFLTGQGKASLDYFIIHHSYFIVHL